MQRRRWYKAHFYIKDKDGRLEKVGHIIVNDDNTTNDKPIWNKVFNHAPPECRGAIKVELEPIRGVY